MKPLYLVKKKQTRHGAKPYKFFVLLLPLLHRYSCQSQLAGPLTPPTCHGKASRLKVSQSTAIDLLFRPAPTELTKCSSFPERRSAAQKECGGVAFSTGLAHDLFTAAIYKEPQSAPVGYNSIFIYQHHKVVYSVNKGSLKEPSKFLSSTWVWHLLHWLLKCSWPFFKQQNVDELVYSDCIRGMTNHLQG